MALYAQSMPRSSAGQLRAHRSGSIIAALLLVVGLTACSITENQANNATNSSAKPEPTTGYDAPHEDMARENDAWDSRKNSRGNGAEETGKLAVEAESVLQHLPLGDNLMYTGQGNHPLAGLRFGTEDGNVNCHVNQTGIACGVDEHTEWPEEDRATGEDTAEGTPDTIGWSVPAGAPFGEAPKTWKKTSWWPNTTAKMRISDPIKFEIDSFETGERLDTVCGQIASTIYCVSGDHGFKVSADEYGVW